MKETEDVVQTRTILNAEADDESAINLFFVSELNRRKKKCRWLITGGETKVTRSCVGGIEAKCFFKQILVKRI